MCASGGDFLYEILPYVNLDNIKNNPNNNYNYNKKSPARHESESAGLASSLIMYESLLFNSRGSAMPSCRHRSGWYHPRSGGYRRTSEESDGTSDDPVR